jgi:hypothetical protein
MSAALFPCTHGECALRHRAQHQISSAIGAFAPVIELQPGTSNVTARYLSRPISSIHMSGSTMARTVAKQFAEIPAASGVHRINRTFGDCLNDVVDLAGALRGAHGRLP